MGNNLNRRIVQIVSTVSTNGYLKGFLTGAIYKGDLKQVCVPSLNCYSCPGAVGSCPIGSLQAVISSFKFNISYYVLGLMSLFGILFGRLICGFLCPFGFLQELLYKIPFKKFKVSSKANNILKYLKYIILLVFVIILPLGGALYSDFGTSKPYFCELICPVGTLEGGIPLVLMNESLKGAIGLLYYWKMFLLVAVILLSITIYRGFCRFLCPLGAFYALFNKVSFYSYKVDKHKCTNCKACHKACKLDIKVYEVPNSNECIRCGECIGACSVNAIEKGFKGCNTLPVKIEKTKVK